MSNGTHTLLFQWACNLLSQVLCCPSCLNKATAGAVLPLIAWHLCVFHVLLYAVQHANQNEHMHLEAIVAIMDGREYSSALVHTLLVFELPVNLPSVCVSLWTAVPKQGN